MGLRSAMRLRGPVPRVEMRIVLPRPTLKRVLLLLPCVVVALAARGTADTMRGGAAPEQHIPAQKLLDATVCITGDAGGDKFESSGFVVTPGDRIVTTAHGIEGLRNLRVKLHDGRVFPARVERLAKNQIDLALVDLIGIRLPEVERATVADVKVGDEVSTVGCPQGFDFSVTRGIVSSVRDVGLAFPMIQTDVPVSPGSSGGGLFDRSGRVVGIIKSSAVGRDRINFALPVDFASELIAESDRQLEAYALFNQGVAAATPEEKTALYRKATTLAPDLVEARYNLALALEKLGKPAEAEREYQELLRIDPANERAAANLGAQLYAQKRFAEAVAVDQRALEVHPDSLALRNNLAEAYRAAGDIARARKEFTAIVTRAPDYAPAHYGLGLLFDENLHDPKHAAEQYRRYLELAPDASDAPQVRAWLERLESPHAARDEPPHAARER